MSNNSFLYTLDGVLQDTLPFILADCIGNYIGIGGKGGIVRAADQNDEITIRGLYKRFHQAEKIEDQIKKSNIGFYLYDDEEKKLFIEALQDTDLCYKRSLDLILITFNKDKALKNEILKRKEILRQLIIHIRNH